MPTGAASPPSLRAFNPVGRPERLHALDLFRGLTLAAMIIVNNPGSHRAAYGGLRHAHWNGARPADFIFPFFLFVVGAAVQLALAMRPPAGVLRKILRRTLLLLAIGLVLNGFPGLDWTEIRIPGVLQRIALCYAAASILVVFATPRTQLLAAVAALLVYWLLMSFVPVPGFGAGVFRPGKDLASFIDRWAFGGHLLFPHWDPEGLFSTLPAISTTLCGVLTTAWLRRRPRGFREFLAIGTPLVVAAFLVAPWFPINKNLWSPAYVLLTSGAAIIGLGACGWVLGDTGLRRWSRPWAALGANPIAIYVLSTLVDKLLLLWPVSYGDGGIVSAKQAIFDSVFLVVGSAPIASLLYALVYLAIWMAGAQWLYRKGIFIRL